MNPTAAQADTFNSAVTFTRINIVRFYIYFSTLPNANTAIFSFGTTAAGIVFKQSDSSLYLTIDSTNPTGSAAAAVTTGRWYLIDLKADTSANPWALSLQVNGGIAVTASNGVAASTPTSLSFGSLVTMTADFYIDDFILSATLADYPIGAGQILHFVPTSDGTHTATTTTIVKGTIAAPTGGGNVAGSSDVFNWVNGVPLLGGATDNTRLVNQQTAGITLYAECVFGAAPNVTYPFVAPRAVEVITADREATTATCDFTAKINDNGTEATIIARGVVAGVISDRYATKQFATPPTGGAWNMKATGAGSFKNLRARWGYASDATPDLYWRGIMVEAEFGYRPPQNININQSVNRASTY